MVTTVVSVSYAFGQNGRATKTQAEPQASGNSTAANTAGQFARLKRARIAEVNSLLKFSQDKQNLEQQLTSSRDDLKQLNQLRRDLQDHPPPYSLADVTAELKQITEKRDKIQSDLEQAKSRTPPPDDGVIDRLTSDLGSANEMVAKLEQKQREATSAWNTHETRKNELDARIATLNDSINNIVKLQSKNKEDFDSTTTELQRIEDDITALFTKYPCPVETGSLNVLYADLALR